MDTVTDAGADVALRCATVVFRQSSVLLLHRTSRERDDWVLPGGRPNPGEGLQSCARREVMEETGLTIMPRRCLFVLETISPSRERLIEIVFIAERAAPGTEPMRREDGLEPHFVELDALHTLRMKPPLAGHIRAAHGRGDPPSAPYLGNLWRADEVGWEPG